jgi:hypothetical protein
MSAIRVLKALALSVAVLFAAWLVGNAFVRRTGAQEEKPPAEKKTYKLAVSFARKDVIEKENKVTMSIEIKSVLKLGVGGNVQETPSDTNGDIELTEKHTDTILDATEAGEAKKVRREYASSVMTVTMETEAGGKTEKNETPFDGKTFVIERGDTPEEGFNVQYDGPKYEVPESARRSLTLDEEPSFLLPATEVAVGETWTPTSENIKKYMAGAIRFSGNTIPLLTIKSVDGTAKCKLKEVIEEEGRRRAIVSYKIEAEIELDPKKMSSVSVGADDEGEDEGDSSLEDMSTDMSMKLKLTGEFELCLFTSKYARHETTATFEFEMSAEQTFEGMGSVEMNMKGKGTMEKSETWKVSKEE